LKGTKLFLNLGENEGLVALGTVLERENNNKEMQKERYEKEKRYEPMTSRHLRPRYIPSQ